MRLLLDTHALLWWLEDSARLPDHWKSALASPTNRVAVSAASILEIAIKLSLGRLQIDETIDIETLGLRCGFSDLPITAAHAAQLRRLPWHHRDPFDRILVAQAQAETMTLVSLDQNVTAYDVALL
jgi:PIN domain nuclease of toxin-antitoxin system